MLRGAVPTHSESVFGAFGSRPGCVVEAFSEGNQIIFTEIMEIRILRNMGNPSDNNADQADSLISAAEAREWQRQQGENEAGLRR